MKLISVLLAAATLPLLSPYSWSPYQGTPCDSVAQAMHDSCKLEKRSDHKRAVALCRNLSDPAERTACLSQAAHDLHDALEECDAQHAKRLEVCADLGGEVYEPSIDPRNFVRTVDNPYFPMIPGTTLVYEGQTPEGLEHTEVHVLAGTREIMGVTCTTVHDVSTVGGRPSEDTLDWYAQDVDGNVWVGSPGTELEFAL